MFLMLLPVLVMGLLGAILVTALGVLLLSGIVSVLYTAGSSLVASARRRRAGYLEEAIPGAVAIPTRFTEVEDWPEAA